VCRSLVCVCVCVRARILCMGESSWPHVELECTSSSYDMLHSKLLNAVKIFMENTWYM